MEGGAGEAQGLVELWRQQQHEEGGAEGQLAVEQPQADADGDDGDGECRDELEGEGGDEGELQDAQGGAGEVLAEPPHALALGPLAREEFERRQGAQDFGETCGEAVHRAPLRLAGLARHAADQVEQERRNRDGHEHQKTCHRVDEEGGEEQAGHGDGDAEHDGQDARVPSVERVRALECERQQLAREALVGLALL